MNRSGSSLASFLPPHSFVMGKRGRETGEVFEIREAREVRNRSALVFVAEEPSEGAAEFAGSAEGALLRRILEAMKIPPERAVLLFHGGSDLRDRIRDHHPAVLVFFGSGALRDEEIHGLAQELPELRVAVTESLAAMVAEPGRKKAAWEVLKRLMPEEQGAPDRS